jgi:hypothetical protein
MDQKGANTITGMCNEGSSVCSATIDRSADTVNTALFDKAAADTSLVTFSLDLQQKILLSPLVIAAGLFILCLFFLTLTLAIANRQAHLMPGRRLRSLKFITFVLTWLSTALAMTACSLSLEMINGLQYVLTAIGNSEMSISTGKLLQVLQLAIFALSVLFSLCVMILLKRRGGVEDDRMMVFDRPSKGYGDDHIIVI